MTELDNANRLFETSVKLCGAVQKHKCLYDRISTRKNAPPECEIAWQLVSKECNETIVYCKNRWKSLCKSFFQGLKRRGNRYYLHDYMDFLLIGGKSKTKRQPDASLNEETNSTTYDDTMQKSFGDDISQHESLMDTINVEDDDENSDSQTTSADESNEMNKSQETTSVNNEGGIFIIDEIGEDANEAENSRRLSYKRSCKRGFDPQLIEELADEEPEEKRPRTGLGYKNLTKNQDIPTTTNKKVYVRIDKIKLNKQTNSMSIKEDMWSSKVNANYTKSENVSKGIKSVKMIDRSTATNYPTRDSGTQYETVLNNLNYDEIFLQTVKNKMQEMNGRQKLNFKRKIYQSLLEVFDDATDFPSANEVLELPPKQAPRVVNTTTGELRLMRELVSLVHAAKNTPEIVNAKDKVKTIPPTLPTKPLTKITTTPNDNHSRTQASPLSLSPSLDEDDLQFSLDHIDDDDDIQLPQTWSEIKSKTNESVKAPTTGENVVGLPRHVIQKVVRVSGTTGSTIVTRDGDKKRIYRIYPKTNNPNINAPISHKTGSNIGTFYVPTGKKPNEVVTSSNKLPVTVRAFNNKPSNNLNETGVTINNIQQTSGGAAINKTPTGQTPFKNVHPANMVLSASTGLFKMVPSTKSLTPITNKTTNVQTAAATPSPTISKSTATAKSPMLPPSSNYSVKRPITVRSHINQPQLMQRRYSICGPLPTENTTPPKGVTTANSNSIEQSSSISQIQISQPISLNTSHIQDNTSPKTVPSSVQTKSKLVSSTPAADIKLPIKTTTAKESIATKKPVTSASEPEEIPVLQTAGTVGADDLDPLLVKQSPIKTEPLDD